MKLEFLSGVAKVAQSYCLNSVSNSGLNRIFKKVAGVSNEPGITISLNPSNGCINQGIKGMRVGGKRRLRLPPTLIYGPAGMQVIQGNQVCYFVIELLAVLRKHSPKALTTWCLFAGLVLGFITDGILVVAGA